MEMLRGTSRVFQTRSGKLLYATYDICRVHRKVLYSLQVSPSFVGTGVFSLGSRFRYSGHTEKQVMQQVQSVRRQQPQVIIQLFFCFNCIRG